MLRWPLLIPAFLCACATTPNRGAWIGDVTPRAPGPACANSRGVAILGAENRATFTPNEGTWMLLGTAEPDGRVTAERITQGADKKPYETRLEGRWTPTTLTGVYTTPRCAFDVTLTKR